MENRENVGKEAKKEVLIIIPAYNEEKTIVPLLEKLEQPEIAQVADVLVVNDASQDKTNHVTKKRNHTGLPMYLIWVMGVVCSLVINMRCVKDTAMLYKWMQTVSMTYVTFWKSIRNCRKRMRMGNCRILSLDQDSWKEVLDFRFHLPKRLHLYGFV